ncbi:hypothetical protein H5410_038091 [Solanum commersonii]|uniref:Uncharacterized protein n=1 Tax=Solanum commersonii TaxID=4109 RepID=A0A9J5Y821_SOLCO|nr:hypothetical protein H5410_038091 [Solanum commersonii]
MGINSTDYNLIIVEKYHTSFLSQEQVNFGEWIIYNNESLTDFWRVPNDYIDQIKSLRLVNNVSPLSVNVHPRLENPNSVDEFPITQFTDFSNMTHYQNILTGRYDVDLNETINESDWENITQDEPIDPVNIDDHDLPNYGSRSASDSDDLPNAEESGDTVLFEASSSDDDFLMPNRSPRPMSMSPFCNHEIPYLDHLQDGLDIFGDTHDEYTSQRTWGEPKIS